MAVDDCYKVTLRATGGGHAFLNVLAVTMTTEPTPTAAIFQAFADEFKTAILPQQTPLITWQSWRAVQVYGTGVSYSTEPCNRVGGLAFEGNITTPLIGTASSSDALPPQCAMVVTLGSAFIGRRKRGRTYLYGFGEAAQASGIWTTTIVSQVQTNFAVFFNKYKEGGTDANLELGTWSERTAFGCEMVGNPPVHTQVDPPHPELAFTPTSSFTVRPNVQTQRRRAVGVGI